MGKKSDAFLLSDGDRLRLSSKTTLIFNATCQIDLQPFDLFQERDMQSFSNRYAVTDRLLGSGAFGKAFMAIEQTTRTQVACKIVDLKVIGPKKKTRTSKNAPQHGKEYDAEFELKKVQTWGYQKMREIPLETKLSIYLREFQILSSISHPNIIALDKVFITNENLYIFQDLLTGGDLYTYLGSKNNNLLEVEAATIVWQVLIAVQFLHERNIAHRDLKPENIMLTSLTTGAKVVLTNFGSARKVMPFSGVSTTVRSKQCTSATTSDPSSEAPGKNKGTDHSLAADMWSVGMIAALLLLGVLPFDDCTGQHDTRLAMSVRLTKLEKSAHWSRLGERPKSFIRGLLVSDENDRMTVKEALGHAWFSNAMHKTDFKELYQRTVKHIRPRVSSVPVVEFIQGRSNNIRYLKCSRQLLDESEPQLRQGSRSRNVPVEPPYKPFPRKMHEQGGLWPKRRKTRSMSEEVAEAIANDWSSNSTKRVNPLGQVTSVGLSRRFKTPVVPALRRSATSGKTSSTSWPVLQRSVTSKAVSNTSDPDVKISASAAIVAAYHLRQGFYDATSTAQGAPTQQFATKISSFNGTETAGRRSLSLGSMETSQTNQKISDSDKMPIAGSLKSVDMIPSSYKKSSVALNVRSRSKLASRSRSSSADSSISSTLSRKRRKSLFDYDVDDNDTRDTGKMEKVWEGRVQARNDQVKDSVEGMDYMVWAHEGYLRMTDEDVE